MTIGHLKETETLTGIIHFNCTSTWILGHLEGWAIWVLEVLNALEQTG